MKIRIITAAAIAALSVAALAGCAASGGSSDSDTAKNFVTTAISGGNTAVKSMVASNVNVSYTANQLKQYGSGCNVSSVKQNTSLSYTVNLKCPSETAGYTIQFNKAGKVIFAGGNG